MVNMSITARFITVSLLIIGGTAITIFSLFLQKALFVSSGVSVTSKTGTLSTSGRNLKTSRTAKSSSTAVAEQDLAKKLEQKERDIEMLREELRRMKEKVSRYKKRMSEQLGSSERISLSLVCESDASIPSDQEE